MESQYPIDPLNFDNDPAGISAEVLRIVRHWMDHGVRIFRVDNPHTKPVAFWEWLLREIRSTDPDVLFLSEAFTRPAMMRGLGSIGFHQSYTYFTWRTAKGEIDREDWGITWNVAIETGGMLVGKKVQLEIDAEAHLQA